MSSLRGRTVLVTRAAGPPCERLAGPLREAGAQVVRLPTVDHRTAPDTPPLAAALEGLADFDWLIFTSRNGVEFFAQALAAAGSGQPWPEGLKAACVGPATAQALADRLGVEADLVPEARFRALALAEALIQRGVRGSSVLYPRAAAAAPTLAERLRAAGARVEAPVAYETVAASTDPEPLRRALGEQGVDAVVFASASAVRGLGTILGELPGNAVARRIQVVCLGPTSAKAARLAGLDVTIQPVDSTIPALVDALGLHFADQRMV